MLFLSSSSWNQIERKNQSEVNAAEKRIKSKEIRFIFQPRQKKVGTKLALHILFCKLELSLILEIQHYHELPVNVGHENL